jgi:two-component system sensor histidine kinase KdpD
VVSNLLDLSRVEGGVLAAHMEWCVAEDLVGAGLQASAAFLAGVDVRTELPDDPPLVRADPVLTERILTNLLHNAVRHGAPPVTVSVRCGSGTVELAVTDSGGGVDPGVLPSVFEPFIHREGVGLGLGLPLCRRLAEAQEARLEHRRDRGGGASFVIVFPFRRPPPIES